MQSEKGGGGEKRTHDKSGGLGGGGGWAAASRSLMINLFSWLLTPLKRFPVAFSFVCVAGRGVLKSWI